MFIEKLSSLGALVGPEEFVKTDFEWAPEEGADPVKFEILVKKEITVADYEAIQFGELGGDDASIMARRISRLVRVISVAGEKVPEERISIEDAKRLKPSLMMAFIMAVNEVEKGAGKSPKTQPKVKTKAE